jgi:FixJ family two-component response regulator
MPAPPAAPDPIVYIVDDNDGVRETLELLFESVNQAVKSFASGRDFLSAYPMGQSGCLITDVRMPEMSGLELYDEMRRRSIELPVIFITGFGDIEMAVNAMKAGAADFIAKPYKEQELLDRVQKAVKRSVEMRRQSDRDNTSRGKLALLSPREREVLDLVVSGESSKRIAHALNLSLKTVEFHRANIMKKLEAKSVADLVKKTIGGDT